MDYSKQQYSDYIKKKSPNSPLLKNVIFAFLVGGLICTIGEGFSELYSNAFGMSEEAVKSAVPITMIFWGALLTGLNVYHKIAKFAGAGTIVPITGFANSIVSPAMEFKREGWVLGLAAKMFVIAGPVLVYGINASVILGILYYIIQSI
jgi:stage V sporulation protein AC